MKIKLLLISLIIEILSLSFLLILLGCDQNSKESKISVSKLETQQEKRTEKAELFSKVISEKDTVVQVLKSEETETIVNPLFDNFFLVRPPEFLNPCDEISPDGAVIILSPGTDLNIIKNGDVFFIVTKKPDLVKSTFKQIIKSCGHLFNIDEVPFGFLSLENKISWDYFYEATLAIKAGDFTPDIFGTVQSLPKGSEKEFSSIIRRYISPNEDINIEKVVKITFPNTHRQYYFVPVSHGDMEVYKTAGDKAIKDEGFLFAKENEFLRLLVRGNITDIIAVTDMDRDGMYEVLVHSDEGGYSGSYEIRLFDGRKFKEGRKVLYRWVD